MNGMHAHKCQVVDYTEKTPICRNGFMWAI